MRLQHIMASTIALSTNRWHDNTVAPHGYRNLERFYLDEALPVWRFACADALLEKRVWTAAGANTGSVALVREPRFW